MMNEIHHLKSTTADFGDPPDWNWVTQFGGSGSDNIMDIVTDETGNIYITGIFSGEISVAENSYVSIGSWDSFIAKFHSDGSLSWFNHISASEENEIKSYGIHIDNSSNIFITGYYTGSVTIGTNILPDNSAYNWFFSKLDTDGNHLLSNTWEGLMNAIGIVLDTDEEGNIYIAGSSNGSTSYNHPSFILTLNQSGNVSESYSSEQTFTNMEIVGDHIFFFGRINTEGYIGTFYFDPVGYGDIFLAKSDLSLNFEWAYMAEHDVYGDSYSTEFYVSENEDIYLTGNYRTDIILGEHDLQGQNGFIAKCNSSGEFLWLKNISEDYFLGTSLSICGNDIMTYVSAYQQIPGGRLYEINSYNANTGDTYNTEYFDNSPEKICYSAYQDKIVIAQNVNELISLSELDLSLETIWNVPFGGNSAQGWLLSVATDQFGHLYSYGYASNNLEYFDQTVERGLFLAKQSSTGEVLWLKSFEDAYQYTGSGSSMITDTISQSIYFATASYNDFLLPDGTILEADESGSTFIIKYSFDGTLLGYIQEGFLGSGLSLSSDYSGNILICGEFSGTITIGNTNLTSLAGVDVFIAKYNSDSDFQWALRAGGEDGPEFIEFISTDSFDNIYLTGEFTSVENTINTYPITLNEGDGNILFAKLDPNGNVLWATSKANSTIPYGDNNCWPTGIQTTPDGYTYIKGMHGDSTYFDNILLTSPYGLFGIQLLYCQV